MGETWIHLALVMAYARTIQAYSPHSTGVSLSWPPAICSSEISGPRSVHFYVKTPKAFPRAPCYLLLANQIHESIHNNLQQEFSTCVLNEETLLTVYFEPSTSIEY